MTDTPHTLDALRREQAVNSARLDVARSLVDLVEWATALASGLASMTPAQALDVLDTLDAYDPLEVVRGDLDALAMLGAVLDDSAEDDETGNPFGGALDR